MLEIKFPAENKPLAAAIGRALVEYGAGERKVGMAVELGMPYSAAAAELEPEDLVFTGTPIVESDDAAEEAANLAAFKAEQEDEAGKSAASTAQLGAGDAQGVKVDRHGVPFDGAMCGKAAEPFYGSGKKSGQWKKKVGVDQADYDAWYAAERAKVDAATAAESASTEAFDTSQAFGQQAAVEPSAAPKTPGDFMGWASEQTTAGHFTQADITQAYASAGVDNIALFNPATAEDAIAKVYAVLITKVPA